MPKTTRQSQTPPPPPASGGKPPRPPRRHGSGYSLPSWGEREALPEASAPRPADAAAPPPVGRGEA